MIQQDVMGKADLSTKSDGMVITAATVSGSSGPPILDHDVFSPSGTMQFSEPALDETTSRKQKIRANLIIFQVASINFLVSMTMGMITTGLPRVAVDLHLAQELYLWPSSVFGLTAGATLLIAGAIADVVGARSVELAGTLLLGLSTLACGLAGSGIQLVVFRAFQGVGNAMHQPCSVALVAQYVPSGKRRNLGFACLGLSMPAGFSLGLVLGGIFVDTIGWRAGFYIVAAVLLVQLFISFKLLPAQAPVQNIPSKLKNDIDWVGALTACAAISMFSYVLAILSIDSENIKRADSIALLVISILLMGFFPVWMRIQEKAGRPPLVPNKLWRSVSFTTVCIVTMLVYAVLNSMELFSSLYFQEVQEYAALQASLRLLPSLVVGTCLNLATGYIVDRISTFWLVVIATALSAIAPLLMAVIDPHWSYWKGAFFAQCLTPLSGDVLFTVGLIVVSEVFPENTQALAGAVFGTVALFGQSLGLNVMQLVSLLVTKGTHYRDKSTPAAILLGYQASFWTMFGLTTACIGLSVFGLRKIGKIGLKKE